MLISHTKHEGVLKSNASVLFLIKVTFHASPMWDLWITVEKKEMMSVGNKQRAVYDWVSLAENDPLIEHPSASGFCACGHDSLNAIPGAPSSETHWNGADEMTKENVAFFVRQHRARVRRARSPKVLRPRDGFPDAHRGMGFADDCRDMNVKYGRMQIKNSFISTQECVMARVISLPSCAGFASQGNTSLRAPVITTSTYKYNSIATFPL